MSASLALDARAAAPREPATDRIAAAPTDRLAGALFIAFVLAVQVPFTLLSMNFDYPDVLRQPAGAVLDAFAAGGRPLVLVWYAYAASIGLFAAAVLRLDRGAADRRGATWLALASAAVQWIALSRWTFAVPGLAQAHAASVDPALRALLEQQFALLNSLLGVGLGEHLGQMLMAAWTVVMLRHLPRLHRAWRVTGRLAALLFVLGLSEQIGSALAVDVGWLAQAPMVAFVVWSVWLVAVGVHLGRRP